MKNKIKSYSFWVALSGSIVIFVNALGELFGFSVQDDLISGLIMAFAGIFGRPGGGRDITPPVCSQLSGRASGRQ